MFAVGGKADVTWMRALLRRVVDELIVSFTHDREMRVFLPGVTPTGRKVVLPHVVVSARQCPLLGVKRTSEIRPVMSAYNPKRTWAVQDCCRAN
jgi:hypothetical protein